MEETGEIAIFEAKTGEIRVPIQDESVWLSQRQMAEVFDTCTDNISLHLKNIYADGEMTERATTEDFSVVRQEGHRRVRRRVRHYNLENLRQPDDTWKVRLIEEDFHRLMFEETED